MNIKSLSLYAVAALFAIFWVGIRYVLLSESLMFEYRVQYGDLFDKAISLNLLVLFVAVVFALGGLFYQITDGHPFD